MVFETLGGNIAPCSPLPADAGLFTALFEVLEVSGEIAAGNEFLVPFCFGLLMLVCDFWIAPLVCLLSEGGCSSSGIRFTRPDFLFPSCVNDEGPSATDAFHGGDSAFGRVGVDGVPAALTLRLFAGRSSISIPF